VIHPAHVAAVNAVFTPTAEQLREATRVIAVLDEAGTRGVGAVNHDGRMIDVAMARTAAALVADAAKMDLSPPEQKNNGHDSSERTGGAAHRHD